MLSSSNTLLLSTSTLFFEHPGILVIPYIIAPAINKHTPVLRIFFHLPLAPFLVTVAPVGAAANGAAGTLEITAGASSTVSSGSVVSSKGSTVSSGSVVSSTGSTVSTGGSSSYSS